jgi:hypothetical protein
MSVLRACLALCLLQLPASALADDDALLESGMPEAVAAGPTLIEHGFVPDGDGLAQNCLFCPGFFAGLGGSFNSVKLDQSFGGTAKTLVFDASSVLVATGTAGACGRRPLTSLSI